MLSFSNFFANIAFALGLYILTKTPPKERFSPEYFHIWGILRIFAR